MMNVLKGVMGAPAPQIFFDSFTDTDGTLLNNHTPDSALGLSWAQSSAGALDILSNRARRTGFGFQAALISPTKAPKKITGIIRRPVSGAIGIACRYSAGPTCLFLQCNGGAMQIYQLPGFSLLAQASVSPVWDVNQDVGFEIIDTGTSIQMTINGDTVSATTSYNNTKFACGPAGGDFGIFVDDFKVEEWQ